MNVLLLGLWFGLIVHGQVDIDGRIDCHAKRLYQNRQGPQSWLKLLIFLPSYPCEVESMAINRGSCDPVLIFIAVKQARRAHSAAGR